MKKPVTQTEYTWMPSEPPAAVIEALQREVFYRDDIEIGLGLSFHCYRRIFSHLRLQGSASGSTESDD